MTKYLHECNELGNMEVIELHQKEIFTLNVRNWSKVQPRAQQKVEELVSIKRSHCKKAYTG